MLPEPLHPAIVHFPIALVVMLPFAAAAALFAIRRGVAARLAWAVPLVVAAVLTVSAWVAVQTGEAQEDRVERVVAESAIETHEEAAERFLVLSGVLLLVAGAGLARGSIGAGARIVATAGSLGLVLAGVQVGGSGGDLVYRHGAADAYVGTVSGSAGVPARPARGDDD